MVQIKHFTAPQRMPNCQGVGWAVVCWGWNLVLCYQCMVERTREQLKYTYLHLFVNRQSKNSLADVVLLTQIRNHGGTTGCNFDIFGLCLWNRFFLVQSNAFWMKLQFLEKICYNKRGSFVLLHKFWDTSVLFWQ